MAQLDVLLRRVEVHVADATHAVDQGHQVGEVNGLTEGDLVEGKEIGERCFDAAAHVFQRFTGPDVDLGVDGNGAVDRIEQIDLDR